MFTLVTRAMQLPLLSGLTGSEGSFHDWNYLLTETGLLGQTVLIAKIIRVAETLLIIAAAVREHSFTPSKAKSSFRIWIYKSKNCRRPYPRFFDGLDLFGALVFTASHSGLDCFCAWASFNCFASFNISATFLAIFFAVFLSFAICVSFIISS